MSFLPQTTLDGGASVLSLVASSKPFDLARAMRAVRKLPPGESLTAVLLDRRGDEGRVDGAGSLRANVTRNFTGGYSARLEDWDHVMEEWDAFTAGPAGEFGQEDPYLHSLEAVRAVLGYYAHLATTIRTPRREEKSGARSSDKVAA